MRNLELEEVSEMTFRYSQDNHVNLLAAYNHVKEVLGDVHNFEFEEVKQFLFKVDFNKE